MYQSKLPVTKFTGMMDIIIILFGVSVVDNFFFLFKE
jgi:hypothetical protein